MYFSQVELHRRLLLAVQKDIEYDNAVRAATVRADLGGIFPTHAHLLQFRDKYGGRLPVLYGFCMQKHALDPSRYVNRARAMLYI